MPVLYQIEGIPVTGTTFMEQTFLHILESISEIARMGEIRNAYRILVGKPEGKRPLGRPRRRWVDDIKMDHREIEWGAVDWIDLVQDRYQWRALVNLRVP
jgi:hypothetical protein